MTDSIHSNFCFSGGDFFVRPIPRRISSSFDDDDDDTSGKTDRESALSSGDSEADLPISLPISFEEIGSGRISRRYLNVNLFENDEDCEFYTSEVDDIPSFWDNRIRKLNFEDDDEDKENCPYFEEDAAEIDFESMECDDYEDDENPEIISLSASELNAIDKRSPKRRTISSNCATFIIHDLNCSLDFIDRLRRLGKY